MAFKSDGKEYVEVESLLADDGDWKREVTLYMDEPGFLSQMLADEIESLKHEIDRVSGDPLSHDGLRAELDDHYGTAVALKSRFDHVQRELEREKQEYIDRHPYAGKR